MVIIAYTGVWRSAEDWKQCYQKHTVDYSVHVVILVILVMVMTLQKNMCRLICCIFILTL